MLPAAHARVVVAPHGREEACAREAVTSEDDRPEGWQTPSQQTTQNHLLPSVPLID